MQSSASLQTQKRPDICGHPKNEHLLLLSIWCAKFLSWLVLYKWWFWHRLLMMEFSAVRRLSASTSHRSGLHSGLGNIIWEFPLKVGWFQQLGLRVSPGGQFGYHIMGEPPSGQFWQLGLEAPLMANIGSKYWQFWTGASPVGRFWQLGLGVSQANWYGENWHSSYS